MAEETFDPQDPNWESRVRAAFAEQGMMRTLGVDIVELAPGRVEFSVPYDDRFDQQDGYLHAGVAYATMDTACGFASFSLMPPHGRVLTVESKVNLLSPATGDMRVTGRVLRAGRTLTVCQGDAYLIDSGKHVATLLTTMIQAPQ
jgi:uncharacterized protein (TIGR00369 family)